MDGVQLPEGYSDSEEAAYFLPLSSLLLYKFDKTDKIWEICKLQRNFLD